MGQVLALDTLLSSQQVWRGPRRQFTPKECAPTGIGLLDNALPLGGWPEGALTEVLIQADGVGELDLLMPTLARITANKQRVALIAPPYVPYAPAWQSRGVVLKQLHVVDADAKLALWAMEQCLRSGSFAAVLAWPQKVDHHGLLRLQVAADAAKCLGFVIRDRKHALQSSPASLRLEISMERSVIVRKCRGGIPPQQTFAIPVVE